MDTSYFNSYGLVTSQDPTTENGGLFLAHFQTLTDIIYKEQLYDDLLYPHYYKYVYVAKMSQAIIDEGLYLRSVHHPNKPTSHDEISGMVVSSHILDTFHKDSITRYLASHWGNYPATGSFKAYNPANYWAWFRLSSNWTRWLSYLFLPFYTINLLLSLNKPKEDTSSKLISFIELNRLKDISLSGKILWSYHKGEMEKMYGERYIKALYEIYFQHEPDSHPIRYMINRYF